jgi:hypothetical protein
MGVATGFHGKGKLEVIKLHRLVEFERVFSLYLEGKTTAAHVQARAKAMLEVGLPRLK